MFFDHYPYTNFHNINLDWVLQAVKAWGQTVEANDRAFRDLKEANEDFKHYVTNYLQDLDITDEINTKLDAMLASGVLTPYFAPYVKGYVDSWLASHVTPTSPALDSTLTLSGAAARADSTGKRLKDLAYVDALSTPEVIASLNRSQVLPGYRVQGIAYDYNGHYYVCGGSVDETGTGVIVKMTKPDFTDAEITEIPQLGHANDITYYDGYLYVCTVGGGDAPRWGIYKINVNDFTDKTLISNAPENTIGISYRQGDFWVLAPYRIYRTTDFTSYEVVVANTNDLLTAYGIPTEGRISQTLFRAAGYLIGWVCSFVYEDRHYGALTFFNSTGEPIAFKMFPAYHSEIQGAVYAHMSIYLVTDGKMVNVFRMDPRHLSYVQLKAGDDLNSFTGRGTLYSTGSNVSAELLNSPSAGEGFTVQVDRLGVYNTIQTARTNSGRELYRIKSFNSDTWGEWIEPAAEVAEIKKDLIEVRDRTKNELNINDLVGASIELSNGELSGTASAFSNAFANGIPIDHVFEENTQYTLSFDAYCTGTTTTGTGLRFVVKYTDGSQNVKNLPNSTRTYVHFTYTTASNKTISYIGMGVNSGTSNTWHLKAVQIEKGSKATEYVPYYSAVDYTARAENSNLERNSVKYPLSKFYHANNDVVLVSSYSSVIAKYDELVALYPDYITKNELSVGNFKNYEYVLTFGNYNAKETRRTKDAIISKPKILICSGVHGYEKSSVMGLYALVKSLCESDFALHNLIGNTVIKIIPIVCPWGYDNNSRLNENGVNINRNFASSDWESTPQGDNYSGATAGDQPETQVVQNWIDENTDAVLMLDWHNSQYVSEISCLLADNTDDLQVFKKKYLQAIESVIPYWQIDRGLNNSNVYAYSASSVATGTTKNYAKDKGILSGTLETSWNVGNTGKDSLETINTNAEVMGNLLIGVESYYEF